jgi:hypothetical protein
MTFDTGHFYIGSSKHVKTRFVLWKTSLQSGRFGSRIIKHILPSVSVVSFEVLEVVDEKDRLSKETEYIEAESGSVFMLNRVLDAVKGGTLRPLPTHLEKPKRVKVVKPYIRKENPKDQRKKVYQFSVDGTFIQEFPSIAAAARFEKVDDSSIYGSTRAKYNSIGKRKWIGVGGKHVYRLEKKFPLIEERVRGVKPKKTTMKDLGFPNSGKPIIDLNTGIFYSATEVASLLGIKTKSVNRILAEERKPNTTQYRYA